MQSFGIQDVPDGSVAEQTEFPLPYRFRGGAFFAGGGGCAAVGEGRGDGVREGVRRSVKERVRRRAMACERIWEDVRKALEKALMAWYNDGV